MTVEVGEAEQVVRFLEGRVEPHRFAQAADGVCRLPHLVAAVAQQIERLRHAVEKIRLLEVGHGARQVAVRGVDGAETEVRQEGVGVLRHRPPEQRLGAMEVPLLVEDHAREDERLEVVGLDLEHLLEIAQRRLGVAFVEVGLAEKEGQLVVRAIELPGLLERALRALDIEGEEGVLGVVQMLGEELGPVSLIKSGDAVADRHETLALLQSTQLVVHLRLPEVAPLLPPDQPPALEELAQRGEAGLRHEQILLLLLHGGDELLGGLRSALDRLLENRDPFQQVLVEREVGAALGLELLGFAADRTGDHHQLLMAAGAELAVAQVLGAADLAEDAGKAFSRRHRTRARSCGRDNPRPPSSPAAGRGGTSDRRSPPRGRAGCPGKRRAR